jgi:hypothetical protein
VAQQAGTAPAPPSPNGNGHTPHPTRHESPIGPDEVYDQEADDPGYNKAMYTPDDPHPTKKEHVG